MQSKMRKSKRHESPREQTHTSTLARMNSCERSLYKLAHAFARAHLREITCKGDLQRFFGGGEVGPNPFAWIAVDDAQQLRVFSTFCGACARDPLLESTVDVDKLRMFSTFDLLATFSSL